MSTKRGAFSSGQGHGHLVAISHPDKIFSSEVNAIKFELVAYYLQIADLLSTDAYDRQALLERLPHGAGGPEHP